jgi:hypothetical protein
LNVTIKLKLKFKEKVQVQGQAQGVKSISEDFENDLKIYVKLFTILYADDTVLLAESAEELQSELSYFYEYCEKWNLKVNTKKTKVIGHRIHVLFMMDDVY